MKGQARGRIHKLQQGKFWLNIRKNILHCEGGGAGLKTSRCYEGSLQYLPFLEVMVHYSMKINNYIV